MSGFKFLIIFVFLFSLPLMAEDGFEYTPFTGSRISFNERFTMLDPECGKKNFYPSIGLDYQWLGEKDGKPPLMDMIRVQ